jgi:hypothetical protein
MFIRISRSAANIVACAIVIAAAVMVLPAAADTKKPTPQNVPENQTLAACARSDGCGFVPTGNNPTGPGYGCGPYGCFTCNGSTCHATVVKGGQHPVGHLPVGRTDAVTRLLRASTTRRAAADTAHLHASALRSLDAGPVLHGGYTNPIGPTAPTRIVHRQHWRRSANPERPAGRRWVSRGKASAESAATFALHL